MRILNTRNIRNELFEHEFYSLHVYNLCATQIESMNLLLKLNIRSFLIIMMVNDFNYCLRATITY